MSKHAYLWINGEWTGHGPVSTKTGVCLNPATSVPVASFSEAQNSHVSAAIGAARSAFHSTAWAHSPRLRAQVLFDFADRLAENREGITHWLTLVNGKLLRESADELSASISELHYYAGLARNIFGQVIQTDPGCYSKLIREPLGVVGIITPWNAPLTMLVRSLAPALAAGCSVVIKSAPQTSVAIAMMLECLANVSELPLGIVNFFIESGSSGAQKLVESFDVDVISFTGSTDVGKQIAIASAGTMKRLSLELGGKSPSLIFPDANLMQAVQTITSGATAMAGQMRTAAARVLVHESIAARLRNAFTESFKNVKVGPGLHPNSDMGPLIDLYSRDRILAHIEQAADEGRMLVRGQALPEYPQGAFVSPTLVEIQDLSSRYIQNEMFGPFLIFEKFADEEEAIARANAARYGLSASVWTSDMHLAERVSHQLLSGTVWINSYNRLLAEAATGGYRESGLSRLHGREGLDTFLQTKHIYHEVSKR